MTGLKGNGSAHIARERHSIATRFFRANARTALSLFYYTQARRLIQCLSKPPRQSGGSSQPANQIRTILSQALAAL